MPITPADRVAITDVISLHGHIVDGGELDQLHDLFTSDITYDLSDFGLGILEGIPAVIDTALTLGAANPVGHHVTNVVLTELDDNRVHARSKGVAVFQDGTSGSITHEDTLTRDESGWRISHRIIRARRTPLNGKSHQ